MERSWKAQNRKYVRAPDLLEDVGDDDKQLTKHEVNSSEKKESKN